MLTSKALYWITLALGMSALVVRAQEETAAAEDSELEGAAEEDVGAEAPMSFGNTLVLCYNKNGLGEIMLRTSCLPGDSETKFVNKGKTIAFENNTPQGLAIGWDSAGKLIAAGGGTKVTTPIASASDLTAVCIHMYDKSLAFGVHRTVNGRCSTGSKFIMRNMLENKAEDEEGAASAEGAEAEAEE